MRIIIEEPLDDGEDEIILRCRDLNDELMQLIYGLKMYDKKLTGSSNGKIYFIDPTDVFYFEAVDNKVFIYCEKQVYETKMKLYEIEAVYMNTDYFRASKSSILNLQKIVNIKAAFNGRFEAELLNGEKIIISRQYVPSLKEKLEF